MLRRVISLGAAVAVLTVPAVASAATYTVDPGAPAGCGADKRCKTVLEASGAVAAGDTIEITKGAYSETAPIVLSKKNVTVHATPGEVSLTVSNGHTDEPVLTLVEGDVIDGLVVSVPDNGGAAVLVRGINTTVKNSTLARLTPNNQSTAVYTVDDASVPSGTNRLQTSFVFQTPSSSPDGVSPPAIAGGLTSSMALSDVTAISGGRQGAGLVLPGSAAADTPSTVTRSTILVLNPVSDAIDLSSAVGAAVLTNLAIDSSIVVSGQSATGIFASAPATLAGQAPGATITGSHATIIGGAKPIALDAQATLTAVSGPVNATFDRSIVHAQGPSTVTRGTTLLQAKPAAQVALTGSDTTDLGGGDVAVSGAQHTPDDQLFANPAKLNYHLRVNAPAIDKGGVAIASESTNDVDGQPRQMGAATDLGADEFLNLAPTAVLGVPAAGRQNQPVLFDATKSTDPEAGSGGGIAKYAWDFGDGQKADTAEAYTTHAYAAIGTYTVRMIAIDGFGLASAVVSQTVTIGDGTAPTVAITSPTTKTLKIFKTTKKVVTKTSKDGTKTKKTVTTKTRNRFTFSGTAADDAGVVKVELSLRRVSLGASASAKAKSCVYLDGKTSFKSVNCKKPVFFVVKITDGTWAFKTKKATVFKAGSYELAVRATDANGVVNDTPVTVKFKLK